MALTPYDWNQSIQTRMEYIEERLREGSPVVGLSVPEGVLLVSLHRANRKVYEIYDRLVFAGIGNQSDIEAMRTAAIDFAHREGFQRSPDDVTVQRLVGSVLSPALKKAFGDPFTAPFVFRGLFAEVGEQAEADAYYPLGFDGEYRNESHFSVVAGGTEAENRMIELLHEEQPRLKGLEDALQLALRAWAVGRLESRRPAPRGVGVRDEEEPQDSTPEALLREELAAGTVEAGLLERSTRREARFRLLRDDELSPALEGLR